MKTRLLAALICALTAYTGAVADPPTAPSTPTAPTERDICSVRNNQVTGPQVNVSALPLLKGDPAHPKRACSVAWSVLSPNNQPLPIVGCYQGRLLQVRNNAACGSDTGFLWVERMWVVTNADKTLTSSQSATCQELDTTTSAATRDYHPECAPQKSTPEPESKAPAPSPR
jgi:hypothetical protein